MRFAPALPLLLAACSIDPSAPVLQDPPPVVIGGGDPFDDPGYPPVMGRLSLGATNGTQREFTAYDFSMGAYDASVWFGRPGGGPVTLTMTGYPNSDPQAQSGLLRITVPTEALPNGPGALPEGVVVYADSDSWDQPYVVGPIIVMLTTIARDQAESGYGRIAGTLEGKLCEPPGPPEDCFTVVGTFDTRVQFDGL